MSAEGKSIAIVAMGESKWQFIHNASIVGGSHRVADEVWAINMIGGVILHDRLFHMDDLMVQRARAQADPDGNIAAMLYWLRKHPGFYTSKVYEGFPGAIEYPLEDVLNSTGGTLYFNNTVAYAVALAIHEKVKSIDLFGVDFSYPKNQHCAEKGRACVEFLLGRASGMGISCNVAQTSTLLDAASPLVERLYGYDAEEITTEVVGGRVKVTKTIRDRLPTVEEIEERYRKTPKEEAAA